MHGYRDSAVQKQVGAMYRQTHGEEVLRSVSSPLSWFHLTASPGLCFLIISRDSLLSIPGMEISSTARCPHLCENSARELNPVPPMLSAQALH